MSIHFEHMGHGKVYQCDRDSSLPVAIMPRCVLAGGDNLICSFALTPALGINGCVPVVVRSSDDGKSWSKPEGLWPALQEEFSIYTSISAGPDGRLFLFGTQTPIDSAGESFWCDKTQSMKQNELVWSVSCDGGYTWSDPSVIRMTMSGSAEAPGAMCVSHNGTWLASYSPYDSFGPAVKAQSNQVIAMRSTDEGQSWHKSVMLSFEQADSGGAEAWVIELADGRLLATSWHADRSGQGKHFPNAYSLSTNEGQSWLPTRSTGIFANTTVLAAMSDGRALFGYVKRDKDLSGIGLAVVSPSESDFGIETDEMVFRAGRASQSGQEAEFEDWQDFCFGEPSITIMPDKTVLVTYWCIEPDFQGIRYIRLGLME